MLVYIIVIIAFIAILLSISSRIRKAASRAFEREEIETSEFFLVKPEGFLHPISDESKFAFEAYSREFGKGDADDHRQAQILVDIFSDKDLSTVCAEARASGEILSEESDGRACVIRTEEKLETAIVSNFYKIVENGKIYQLKVSVLKDFSDEYRVRIEETLASFKIK